jgi:hypothetical protein
MGNGGIQPSPLRDGLRCEGQVTGRYHHRDVDEERRDDPRPRESQPGSAKTPCRSPPAQAHPLHRHPRRTIRDTTSVLESLVSTKKYVYCLLAELSVCTRQPLIAAAGGHRTGHVALRLVDVRGEKRMSFVTIQPAALTAAGYWTRESARNECPERGCGGPTTDDRYPN